MKLWTPCGSLRILRKKSKNIKTRSYPLQLLVLIWTVRRPGQVRATAVVRGANESQPGEAVAGEATGQIEQFPANVLGRQVEEVTGRFGAKVVQRVQQADQAALEHIEGFGPLADVGEIP